MLQKIFRAQERCVQAFDGGKLREIDHWKDLDLDVAIILKWIFNEYDGDMNWIDVVQDRNRCRILVNTVMNLRIP